MAVYLGSLILAALAIGYGAGLHVGTRLGARSLAEPLRDALRALMRVRRREGRVLPRARGAAPALPEPRASRR